MEQNRNARLGPLTQRSGSSTGDLRSRAEYYLHCPFVISAPGAGLVRLIMHYAEGKSWDDSQLKDELSRGIELAQTKMAEYEAKAGEALDSLGNPKTRAVRTSQRDTWGFYKRTAALLQEIEAEVAGGGASVSAQGE